jgi:hypothetical protein
VIIRLESGSRWLAARIGDFEKWQAGLLEESASRLGAVLDPGGRVHRYGFVGSPVTFRGQRAWLRVSPFLEHEMSRKAWRGTAEAAVILGVSKPELLHRIEWYADGTEPVPVSAEVLTLVTDPVASRERFLRTAPDLPPEWFRDLAASLAALRAYPTDRRFPVHSPEEYGYLLSATYRRPVPATCVPAFRTEHIDLNWENITAPRFCILDMEHWCTAVTGYGAAYLYLTALDGWIPSRGSDWLSKLYRESRPLIDEAAAAVGRDPGRSRSPASRGTSFPPFAKQSLPNARAASLGGRYAKLIPFIDGVFV